MDSIKKCKNNKIIFAALVLTVVFIILPFVVIDRSQDAGSIVYYNEIGIINNKLYYVRYHEKEKAYALYCSTEDDILFLFPEDAGCPAYSLYDDGYYYHHSKKLYYYNPVLDENVELFSTEIDKCSISTVTEDYLCLCDTRTSNPKAILDLYNGSVTQFNIDDGTNVNKTFASAPNKILYWLLTDTKEILTVYHCYDKSMDTVLVRNKDNTKSVLDMEIYKDSIYYTESDGLVYSVASINKEKYEEPQRLESISNVIAMAAHEDGLVCARLNDKNIIEFVLLSDTGELALLDTWDNDKYLVPGSCQLVVEGDMLVCAITSEPEVYFENVFQ